ncbi:MAG: hypothetical protein LBJ63_08875 [Prevotellaceae bacterium]|jgi:hypothetical protein|nr:hypothetical protein [Prevotellaceae bacterium]
MKYRNILEEEVKNVVAADYFGKFDCTRILGKIDFAVKIRRPKNAIDFNDEYLLWAEAKQKPADILVMLAQLVLTIGKARTFDEILPPKFLGCYDSEKIAFVPYHDIQGIFYQNDFNWNVAPSDHDTKEFKQVHEHIKKIIENDIPWETYLFDFEKDEKEIRRFIRENFIVGKSVTAKIKIDKNNFIIIYNKWLETVKPTIAVDWDVVKKNGIIDGDFYLADLLSAENKTLKDKLFVLLHTNYYEAYRRLENGLFTSAKVDFKDDQKAYTQFWAKYERPPHEDYWDYIIERRDLLVPQDVRERKGSFFTPQIWVELSQRYIADVLGEDWQDEYYVWDCAAGTGNLLAGLTNKYNIWASTLDKADVDVMHDRIANGANFLEDHCFPFDFLNDDFSKLPAGLKKIIDAPEERKRLIIYINPPYAEASSRKTIVSKGENKSNVSTETKMYKIFSPIAGTATRELFAQFFLRIYKEIPDCKLASFSTLKYANSQYFIKFRNFFKAKFEKGFVCPANSFDNVNGDFPIGFSILNLADIKEISKIEVDVYDNNREKTQAFFIGTKNFYSYEKGKFIIDWLRKYYDKSNVFIAYLRMQGTDVQNNLGVFVTNNLSKNDLVKHLYATITKENLIEFSIYFAVRKVILATWLNDRDQFLFPNKQWENDIEFQNDCLTYTLFNNNISSKNGVNHWIPFTETEVNSRDKFDSHFMVSFLSGKIVRNAYADLFRQLEIENKKKSKTGWKEGQKREFSAEAQAVFAAGKNLWKYYHAQPQCNVNASLYDIREHFQGRNDKGKMNNKSDNETYNELIGSLRSALKALANKIEPKVYEYGFLRQ